ncbi:MAG: aconitate hydratase AcnA [Acidobacteria bacterium]|nr:aconitate hydratase AcnA [Acidobacteriota bacterium]
MSAGHPNSFDSRQTVSYNGNTWTIFSLKALTKAGFERVPRLPYSIRILLENALRNEDGRLVTRHHIETLAGWEPRRKESRDIPYMPSRVLLQDFTGVPAVVDLAAMRDAMKELGGDPDRINPVAQADLVIDHSVQVDVFGSADAMRRNIEFEYHRNHERYALLRWAQKAFKNFSVVPPGTGICHQVNLEYLAQVVHARSERGEVRAYPDTCVGTDSHTPMVNALGVMGWGVGGIEAEAVLLGQPYYMLMPEVIGFRLMGALPEGATATDVVLTVTQMLRARGVVGKFVEYFGPGLDNMTIPDRAVISNMSPEYGATMGFFPVDDATLDYLRFTGRDPAVVARVEAYCRAQDLFRTAASPEPEYTDILELDLATVEPSLAGPKRPQDRISLSLAHQAFQDSLTAPVAQRGFELPPEMLDRSVAVTINGETFTLKHGSVVIAAITSCTNTSNPSVMIAAGLVARKARERGLMVPPWVKTSLAPGSMVVTDYLEKSGLLEDLEGLHFNLVGYGCTTCIGNSGPLLAPIEEAIRQGDLVVSSVLSGNRNFEGRIHPLTRANYLASPPLVVAYALAGRSDIDFSNEPLGLDADDQPVFLRDLWPSLEEIRETIQRSLTPEMFRERYSSVTTGDATWASLPVPEGKIYAWDDHSTYIKHPPFFEGLTPDVAPITPIRGARVLALMGDSVTTDHISPAGAILSTSPAGRYLTSLGVDIKDYNSYGSRRGNHEVMMRGTFANIRIKNLLLPGTEGGVTMHFPTGEIMPIYEAAMKYRAERTPLLVIAGKEYGTGSSRDWAAKGTFLLGIRAVIAESYERIHRSNLIGMGVLPLQFKESENATALSLAGNETFFIDGLDDSLQPGQFLTVRAENGDGGSKVFAVLVRLDSQVEVEYYRNGGILQTVLRQMA